MIKDIRITRALKPLMGGIIAISMLPIWNVGKSSVTMQLNSLLNLWQPRMLKSDLSLDSHRKEELSSHFTVPYVFYRWKILVINRSTKQDIRFKFSFFLSLVQVKEEILILEYPEMLYQDWNTTHTKTYLTFLGSNW